MKLATYQHQDYSGGLNNTSSDDEIERTEASLLRNWDITYRGQLRRRDGLTQIGDTQTSNISGLHTFYRNDGTFDLLITEDTSLRYLNSTTFDELDSGFTAGTDFAFSTVPYLDRVYLGNEDNTLHYWDRSSTTLNSSLTDLGATVPHGNSLIWHKNHMFTCNNVTVSGTAYENRLYWSDLGDPDTWDTTNDFIIMPGQGVPITLADLGTSLVIFKDKGIQFLDGYGDSDWRITASNNNTANFSETIGIAGTFAHTRVGDEVWFMDDEGIIRRLFRTDFDAFRRDVISSKIENTIEDINKNQLSKVRAWTWNDKVYFSVPTGSSTENDTVLVFDILASKRVGGEAWTTYTGWEASFFTDYPTSGEIQMVVASRNSTKKVYRHTGTSDDGTAIDARWDGKSDDFDRPARNKSFHFGYVTGEADAAASVDMYVSGDNNAFSKAATLSLSPDGSRLGPTGTDTLGPTGSFTLGGGTEAEQRFFYDENGGDPLAKEMKHSIRHNDADEQPTVNTFSSHFKLKVLR